MAAWNQLPDDIKAILNEAAVASSFDYIALSAMADAKAMREMQAAGVQISVIPEEEWVKMEVAARELWEAYANEDQMAARGVELLKKFLAELGR